MFQHKCTSIAAGSVYTDVLLLELSGKLGAAIINSLLCYLILCVYFKLLWYHNCSIITYLCIVFMGFQWISQMTHARKNKAYMGRITLLVSNAGKLC